jgi:Raf kinase inhibitor-like YbhB/YbcL family protein
VASLLSIAGCWRTVRTGAALGVGLSLLLLTACNEAPAFDPSAVRTATAPTIVATAASIPPFSLASSAFAEGGNLPARFSCDGEGVSPPLAWEGAPARTASFVLIVDDPDTANGTFNHWVFYNIPGSARQLPEAIPVGSTTSIGGMQGNNGARRTGYQPACPPNGPAHHYQFMLYALDSVLPSSEAASSADVRKAMEGHELARVQLTGLYQRAQR